MKLYEMRAKYSDDLPNGFCFHARSQAEADRKAEAYNRYHGYCDTPGSGWQIAVEARDVRDSYIHDEYISYLRV